MIKLLGLLHEGTILDLKLVYQLIRRYKFHMLCASFFFLCFFSYNYYSQPIIYSATTPLKVVTSHRVSNDLSSLLPVENATTVTFEELQITFANFSFLKSLGELISQDPDFDTLNFGDIKSRDPLLGRDFKKICMDDKTCLYERMAPSLKGLFYLEQGLTDGRFKLVANAIDKKTTRALASVLVKAVELERIKIRQYSVLKEIKSVASLIDESRSMMIKMGGNKALEDHEKMQNNILDLKERMKMLQYNTSLEIANASSFQAQVSENKKSTKTSAVASANLDTYQKAQMRLKEIKMNLNYFNHLSEEKRTASDKMIISQLLVEQTKLLNVLPAEENLKSLELNESFKEKQIENSGNYEFNYLVSKNKIERLKADYEASKLELNKLLQRNLDNESKVNGMRADLEFLKGLESKLMSLKLVNATMTSDLIFEDSSQQIQEFRRSSFQKILIFAFAITSFLYIISILIRYFIDDKIYGEEEIRLYFKQLDFVGEVPSFD